ncbi:hypothetical protein EPI10_002406 [Gossypium australe]|uniref:Uncharacterized protein n=1 Tax=Gossypium australe TaxID=47621 RepID=A0A5B6VEA4_9ROSI|nr:hypothetical protein EPI10_002406 [Gossypium australe]
MFKENVIANAHNPIPIADDRDRAIRPIQWNAHRRPTSSFSIVNDSFKMAGVTEDALRLKFFCTRCEIEHEHSLIHCHPIQFLLGKN